MRSLFALFALLIAALIGLPLIGEFNAGGGLGGWVAVVWLGMSLVAFVAAYPPAEPCGWHVDISGLCRYLAGWSAVAAVIFMATDLFRNEYDLTATAFALAGVVFALRRLMNWWLVGMALGSSLVAAAFADLVHLDTVIAVVEISLVALPVVFGFSTCLLIALSIHEAAHAGAAFFMGDGTPLSDGRATIAPAQHFTLAGMIVAPAVLATLGSTFVFGWARPVMCDIGKLRDPRRGSAFVAAAGPVANLVVTALVAGFLLAASLDGGSYPGVVAWGFVATNAFLGTINLLPIPPLDGGRIMLALLPVSRSRFDTFIRHEPAFFIAAILLLLGVPWALDIVFGVVWDPFAPMITAAAWYLDFVTGGHYEAAFAWQDTGLDHWAEMVKGSATSP